MQQMLSRCSLRRFVDYEVFAISNFRNKNEMEWHANYFVNTIEVFREKVADADRQTHRSGLFASAMSASRGGRAILIQICI